MQIFFPKLKSKHKKNTRVNLYSPPSKPSISNQTEFSSDAFDNTYFKNLKQNITTIKQKPVLTRVIMLPMISIFVLLAIAILAYGITSVFTRQTDATSTVSTTTETATTITTATTSTETTSTTTITTTTTTTSTTTTSTTTTTTTTSATTTTSTTTTTTTSTTTTTTTSTTTTTTTSTTTTTATSTTTTTTTSITTTTTTHTTATTETTTTSTTTTTTSGSGCYFGEDYVNLVEGGQRTIKNLLVGDRIWTLSNDGKHLIDDEIILMLHAEPKTIIPFYTFITQEGHSISLSGSHNILVVVNGEEKIQIIRASKVTLNHRLIIASRTVGLKTIEYSQRTGFYSPLTRTSYLLVNNISTSVFVDSFHATHDFLHRVFAPIRMYYFITRWLYSDSYNPFETNIKEGLHPLTAFILKNDKPIRLFFIILPHIQRSMFIFTVLYLSRQLFFYGKNHF
ncbi:unnamed protein product [Rotaria magnacalcarata]|uniref:Hint domain-containing protein n=1 Tax=Rotaria magnacalcarata TaxID=392030 RepID=A0A819W2N9_9BILA|nr:unnamed protein product [Rotaria magnacalcarata]CAF4117907.1 unnamed protein product [Rotaria magnacalcarata]